MLGVPLLPGGRTQTRFPIQLVHQERVNPATSDDGQKGTEKAGCLDSSLWVVISPFWIYHPLLIGGSRLRLMWTSPGCVLTGGGSRACLPQAKGSSATKALPMSSGARKLSGTAMEKNARQQKQSKELIFWGEHSPELSFSSSTRHS